jgi:TolA-binding protein
VVGGAAAALLGLGVSVLGAGCVTAAEGDQLKADVASLQRKLGEVSTRSETKVQELDRILKDATRLLGRSSADVGAQVLHLRSDLDKLVGRVEQVGHEVQQLAKQVNDLRVTLDRLKGGVSTTSGAIVPADKEQIAQAARSALSGQKYDDARKLAWAFLNRFKGDPKAAEMQMLIAESYYSQGQFGPAAGEYQKVIDYYPRSPQVPTAILKIGLAFFEQKDCSGARAYLTMLVNKHGRSAAAREARNTLRDIQRVAKNRRRCKS